MFKRKVHSHLHMLHLHFGPGNVLMNFLNSNNEVVDLIYLGNCSICLHQKLLNSYFQTSLF